MSFTDYANLQATVRRQSARSDLDLDIPDFIRMGEARLARKLSALDWDSSTDINVLAGAGVAALPSDYKEIRSVSWSGNDAPLVFMPPAQFYLETAPILLGTPGAYTIEGPEIILGPAANSDGVLTVKYVARFQPLSDTNTTNWLLQNHPDALFYGAMQHKCAMTRDSEGEAKWKGKFDQAIQELEIETAMSMYGGTPLEIRSQ